MQAIIAGAGGAAHLPGMVAALTPLPVIGVPVKPAGAHLDGLDALLSIVQVPFYHLISHAKPLKASFRKNAAGTAPGSPQCTHQEEPLSRAQKVMFHFALWSRRLASCGALRVNSMVLL